MLADLIIEVVEKLFNSAMKARDGEKVKLHEHNRMLTSRARLTSVDKSILGHIEKEAPLTMEDVTNKFNVECVSKRISLFEALGFINVEKYIITIAPLYKPIADKISHNSADETIIINRDSN